MNGQGAAMEVESDNEETDVQEQEEAELDSEEDWELTDVDDWDWDWDALAATIRKKDAADVWAAVRITAAYNLMKEGKKVDFNQLGFGHFSNQDLNNLLMAVAYGLWAEKLNPSFATCSRLFDLLVEAGADVNCKDDDGKSPLLLAHDGVQTEMFQHIVIRWAVAVPTIDDESVAAALVLCITEHKECDEVVRYLVSAGLNIRRIMGTNGFRNIFRGILGFEKCAKYEIASYLDFEEEDRSYDWERFSESLTKHSTMMRFLIPQGFPVPNVEDVEEMAENGIFLTLAMIYIEMWNGGGKSVPLPVNISLDQNSYTSPLPKFGSQILAKVIRRYGGMSNRMGKGCVASLMDCAGGTLRDHITGQGKNLKETMPELPIPEKLGHHITMENIQTDLEKRLRTIFNL